MIKITQVDARKYLLRYQHLYPPRTLESNDEIRQFVRKVGCVQYDPLNRVAKNADLVLQSRCKNYSEDVLYRLLYEKRELLDGWDKNMSIWPTDEWPYFSRNRAEHMARYEKRAKEFNSVKDEIVRRIEKSGYISSRDVFGDKKVDWSWAPTDIGRAVLESMYHCGELVIHHKEGTRKYYGLAKELLSRSIFNKDDPNSSLEDYRDWYVKRRIAAIGLLWNKSGDAWLGTDLKTEERVQSIKRLIEKREIVEVEVANINEVFYMPKEGLEILDRHEVHSFASLIAPLDNLIWDRNLVSALFQFHYKWEVYTPAKDRKFGYYVLPIMYGDKFVGRCEPVLDRNKCEIHMQNWWWEEGIKITREMLDSIAQCLIDFTKFLGADTFSISKNLSTSDARWMKELKHKSISLTQWKN